MHLPFNIVMAQLNPTVGALSNNFEKIETIAAEHDTADIIVFSESITTGYPVDDLVLNHGFMKDVHNHIDLFLENSKNWHPAFIIPTPWIIEGVLYNAALFIHNGKIQNIIQKYELPNDGVFDEKRLFTQGDLPDVIQFKGSKIGLMICEDMWHETVAKHLKSQNADFFIIVNGSPYHAKVYKERLTHAKSRVHECNIPLLYINQVGGQDDLVFDGRSFVMNAQGEIEIEFPAFQEYISDTNTIVKVDALDRLEEIYAALTLGVHDYVFKNGFNGVLIGLSGGIDSALTAAIAVDAFGAQNVQCVMMPSEYTSQDSLDDAQQCAEMLGVEYDIISIKDTVIALEHSLENHIKKGAHDLAFENIQSRARGVIMMALSNATGKMLLTTGNKSEMAVGYATLYGDMCGGYNALKDIYKTDVYALSSWRNEQEVVMPERIITKAPTAELRDNQTDQDSLPPYDILDDILKSLIDDNMAPDEINHPNDLVCDIWKLLDRAEYKRRQSPPGAKITAKAFGRDRRYPITNGYFGSKG